MDHLISARGPNLIIINKKENLQNCRLAVPADHSVKLKEYERKDKYLDLARELKKLWSMKVTIIPIAICAPMILKCTGGLGNDRPSGDHPNYCIIEIGQNNKKSPRDLLSLKL